MAGKGHRRGAPTRGHPPARRRWQPQPICPQRALLLLVSVIAYTFLLSANIFRTRITLSVGDIADGDMFADSMVEVEDRDETENRRQRARDSAAKVYLPRRVTEAGADRIRRLLETIDTVAADTGLPGLGDKMLRLEQSIGLDVPPETLEALLDWSAGERAALRGAAASVLQLVYREGREIRSDEPATRDKAVADARDLATGFAVRDRRVLTALVTHPDVLQPNRVFDADATEVERQRLASEVAPAIQVIQRGQKIVGEGDRVTEQQLRIFEALGWVQPSRDYRGLVARAGLVLLMLLVLGAYTQMELPSTFADTRKLALINLVVLAALVAFRLLIALKGQIATLSHPAILCGAATGCLIAVLIEFRLSMMVTAALAMFMGLLVPGAGLWVAFEAWLAGRVGAMAITAVKDRPGVGRAGLTMAGFGLLIAVAVQLPQLSEEDPYTLSHLLIDACFGLGWGLTAFILAMGVIPMLERPFGCVTPFRLLELTNTSTPALQLLKREARGTFDASLTIGDMAADACEAIGADPLLARACGYHHDIGKVRHPGWFIENQFGGPNVHEKLSPELSAMAIKSHVTEGHRMAHDAKLPEPLCDVIQQHHGTTKISFFYYQALERCPEGQTVDESHFTYEGPKPQFKESGIIMLADGIEAAVRAASQHGPLAERKIHDIVHNLIRKRLEEGQLDECPLTLRDLSIAADSFCAFLRGMYHGRIEYPPQALRPRRNGDAKTNGARA